MSMEKGWGARRGRKTTEILPQRYEKDECGSERREMRLTRRGVRRGRDARALCDERGYKDGKAGVKERAREREGSMKEMKERETEVDSAPQNEGRRNNVRRVEPRRLVPELAWQRQYQHPRNCMAGIQW